MSLRKVIRIDEEKCDGCGECVPACVEGAIRVIDGKARLLREDYCDGLGACLGHCPQGAITIEEREADAFDEEAVRAHLASIAAVHPGLSCPGSQPRTFDRPVPVAAAPVAPSVVAEGEAMGELSHWPVQLHLISPHSPVYRGADLLLAADCAAFARGDFHRRFLAGHALAIACPKLDDPAGYVEKLSALLAPGMARSLTIVRMQVPCCGGLERLAAIAAERAGSRVPIRCVVLAPDGRILSDTSESEN
ncbi:MAG: ATP-binding protein [Candidatus Eisenbacteria bacterium]|nr:4Fe-4S binding protein [Candidatus Eisenbacteria bacterium]